MAAVTYGDFLVGTTCVVDARPLAVGRSEGIPGGGLASQFAGSRGWSVTVKGVWVRSSVWELNELESGLAALADGCGRSLWAGGRRWDEVVLLAGPECGSPVQAAGGGWALEFRACFRALR